jgi:methyltransferase family protein
MNRFAAGVIDYASRMAAGYQAGRALSNEAAAAWSSALAPFVERAELGRILDLVWLSHVWHHIQDRPRCASELRRIVCRAGHVLVRGR